MSYITGDDLSDDVLYGTSDADFIDGQGGNDQLDGGDGDDTLIGGGGDDRIDGGAGMGDRMFLRGNFADYTITYNSATHEYTLVDQAPGRDGTDVVKGVEFFNFADGMKNFGELVPHAGDGLTVTGTANDDFVAGSYGLDSLSGLAGNDFLDGMDADDTLDGGDGDDTLIGGGGDDRIDGGAGMGDRMFLRGNFADYTITYNSTTHEYTLVDQAPGRDGTDVVKGVEFFNFADGMKNFGELVPHAGDGLTVTGTAGDDFVGGSYGLDSLSGLAGNDFLDGMDGDDSLDGGDGDDTLIGGGGDDRIDGGAGMGDRMFLRGNFADYQISYNSATHEYTLVDQAPGRDGTDIVKGVEFFNFADGMKNFGELVPHAGDGLTVTGTAGDDFVGGSYGLDSLSGLAGNDFLDGMDGDDSLDGGDGDDTLIGGGGDDRIDGGAGMGDRMFLRGNFADYSITYNSATHEYTLVDQAPGRDGTDVVKGVEFFNFADGMKNFGELVPHAGDGLTVTGTAGDDFVAGSYGLDSLSGLAGNDFLDGMDGDDSLDGGDGDDTLIGGGGDDRIDGGAGMGDRMFLRGNFADYSITYSSATHEYTLVDQAPGRDGTDVVKNVENFAFADGMKTAGQLVNTAPVAADDTASTLRGQPLTIDVLANDSDADAGDSLTIGGVTQGSHGSVAIDWMSGKLVYSSTASWYGTDTFTYTVTDAHGASATATVSVTVDNSIYGDEFDNSLYGTSDADKIYGLGGNDWLSTSGPFYGQTGADLLDGGAGDDRLTVYSGGLAHTLTGGSGADLFELYKYGDASWIAAPITITDFNAAEGDRLSLNILGNGPALLRGAAPGFTGTLGEAVPGAEQGPGVLQLWTFESNGHTVLFSDTNGDFVVDEHDFWLEFDGSVKLTEDSFVAGSFLPFTGTRGADVFNGTAGADTMWGLRGDDTLNGLGGGDVLYGGAGNDIIDVGQASDTAADSNYADGGEGDDVLIGSDGSDHLIGGSGNDTLMGAAGDDMLQAGDDDASAINTLSGGSGNDFLLGAAGSDTLLGGEGNDYLLGNGGNDHLDAGNGSDTIEAGEGDDTIDVTGATGSLVTATGRTGVDTYRLFGNGGSVWIKDFAAGSGGDVVALDKLLDASTWSGSTNAFDRQFGVFRLLQDGSATQLQWDQDGAGTTHGWQTVATLSGTNASALTLGNFSGSSAITALTVTDGSNGAPFAAASLPDAVANEDAAFAYTVPGNTFVDRDTGDALSYRASLADGGALPSWLAFDASTQTFSGTPLNANVGSLDIRVTATDGAGASASDVFTVTVNNTNDAPLVATALPSLQTNEDAAFNYTVPAATFTDVDAGDSLHLSARLADGSPLPTWLSFDAATHTFSGTPANGDVGSVQIRVTATDNAGAGVSSVLTLNVLNVNDAPVAASDSASTLRSTAVTIDVLANDADVDMGDTLAVSTVTQGSHGSVAIDAASGQLVYTPIANWNGSDTFTYSVSDGHGGSATASVTVAVAGSIVGTDAANTLTGTAGSDSIEAKGGDDTVDAGAGNDYVSGGSGNDRLTGGDGNDTLAGGDGNDTIYGSAGADVIVGGAGNDALYGGVSAKADRSVDTFVFNSALNASSNHDTIYGFEANATDKIALDPAIFAALLGGTSSGVDSSEFRASSGGNAADANDFLLYDTSTGNLYYDADGSGAGAKVWFATLSGLNGTLDYTDFTTTPPPGA